MIEKFWWLREGLPDQAAWSSLAGGNRDRGSANITDVDGMPPEQYREVKTFDQLTPINP